MTPEAHARLLLDFLTRRGTYDHVVAAVYDDEEAVAAVRDYIRQVILEEREACAQVALAINDCCECGEAGCHVGDLCPTAAAIRARSTPSSVGRADSVHRARDPQGAADPP